MGRVRRTRSRQGAQTGITEYDRYSSRKNWRVSRVPIEEGQHRGKLPPHPQASLAAAASTQKLREQRERRRVRVVHECVLHTVVRQGEVYCLSSAVRWWRGSRVDVTSRGHESWRHPTDSGPVCENTDGKRRGNMVESRIALSVRRWFHRSRSFSWLFLWVSRHVLARVLRVGILLASFVQSSRMNFGTAALLKRAWGELRFWAKMDLPPPSNRYRAWNGARPVRSGGEERQRESAVQRGEEDLASCRPWAATRVGLRRFFYVLVCGGYVVCGLGGGDHDLNYGRHLLR